MKLSNYREEGKKSPKQTTPYVTLSSSAGSAVVEQVPAAGTASTEGLGAAGEAPGQQHGVESSPASRTVPRDVLTQFLSSSPDTVKLFQLGRSHPAL